MNQMTVGAAQARALAAGLERIDAQLLLGALLGVDRAWLMIHGDDALSDTQAQRFEQWLAQRQDGVPLAYLVGEKEFHGLMLKVDRHTLVPRPDTEVLVDWALELLPQGRAADLVDLGTGSGAIALALAHRRPGAKVTAVDLSTGALTMARANGEALKPEGRMAGRQLVAALGRPPVRPDRQQSTLYRRRRPPPAGPAPRALERPDARWRRPGFAANPHCRRPGPSPARRLAASGTWLGPGPGRCRPATRGRLR